jgi:hypothetical protein
MSKRTMNAHNTKQMLHHKITNSQKENTKNGWNMIRK